MRFTAIFVLGLFLFIGCESPQDLSNDQIFYKGQVVQNERAPSLINDGGLSKSTDGILTLDDELPDGTVYGLIGDPIIYVATGGEVLSADMWVGNSEEDPVQAFMASKLVVTFEKLTLVTLRDAVGILYVAESGLEVLFSGSGVVNTTGIRTGSDGFVTLISTAEFSVGGDGGEDG